MDKELASGPRASAKCDFKVGRASERARLNNEARDAAVGLHLEPVRMGMGLDWWSALHGEMRRYGQRR